MDREAIAQEISALGSCYGLTVIEHDGDQLLLKTADVPLAELLSRTDEVAKYLKKG